MRIAICDDLKSDRVLLEEYCIKYAEEKNINIEAEVFENADSLILSQNIFHYEMIFLDIFMKGISGVEAARILRNKGFDGTLVFTTTSSEFYADGFEVEAAHYLIKPIQYEMFCEAMRRLKLRMKDKKRMVKVTVGRSELQIPRNGIQYIEVYGHRTTLHTVKGEMVIAQSLAAIEKSLEGEPFIRCYRCYIINMDYVQKMNKDMFIMKDGKEIPISRDRRTWMKKYYMNYIFKRMED